MRQFLSTSIAASLVFGLSITPQLTFAPAASSGTPSSPIKHVVVIFGENISFDHYFGTYPRAMNPPGEPVFHALPDTPSVNGLSEALRARNPNLNPANGTGLSLASPLFITIQTSRNRPCFSITTMRWESTV